MIRPAIGATVELVKDDFFLANYHHVTAGSLGIVTAHSALCADDDGVLVDWGDGKRVRCQLDEIKTSTQIKKDHKVSEVKKFKSVASHRTLEVDGVEGKPRLMALDPDLPRVGIVLTPSDAPALALAILEAAGVETNESLSYSDLGTDDHLGAIKYYLMRYIEHRDARAAAEAVRAALEAEALALHNAFCSERSTAETFDEIAGFGDWLAVARKAREIAEAKEAGQ